MLYPVIFCGLGNGWKQNLIKRVCGLVGNLMVVLDVVCCLYLFVVVVLFGFLLWGTRGI